MTFLLVNQTFHPDLSASAQYLTDLALGLVQRGHRVTVITACRSYTDPPLRFPNLELWHGIRIIRVVSTWFGKPTRIGRAADAISFLACCTVRLLFYRRADVLVALSSPPLLSAFAAGVATLRRWRFCCWVMDFNPDLAIAAGWLPAKSCAANLLNRISAFGLKHCAKIIALDRFMRQRLIARGAPPENTLVLPLWCQDSHVRFDPVGRQCFRAKHGLAHKFVVMYSGNHSVCHPLQSLLLAAESLVAEADICFCFIGDGTERSLLGRSTANAILLPYQPLADLSASLSAADLHVVVMGEPFVGLVHPCKPYNLLPLGAPILYIGPPQSSVTELLATASCLGQPFYAANHGEIQNIVRQIKKARAENRKPARPHSSGLFSQTRVLPQLIHVLESA